MKRYILLLIASVMILCVHSQNTRSIQIKDTATNYNQMVAIHDIDSIVYDIATQKQFVYTRGGILASSISDIHSVSFSDEETVNALITNEYIEGATSYLFSNGWMMSVSEDSISNRLIVLNKKNLDTDELDESESVVIYCDSLYRPFIIVNDSYTYYLDNYSENTFDLKIVDPDHNETVVKGLFYGESAVTRSQLNWSSQSDDITDALNVYGSIETVFNPSKLNIGTTMASWINNLFNPSGVNQDAVSWGISAIAALFSGNLVAITDFVLNSKKLVLSVAQQEAEKQIGKCSVRINDVTRKDGNKALVSFEILGVTSNATDRACYQVNYWSIVNGLRSNIVHTTEWKYAENGVGSIEIPNLTGNRYAFQLILFPEKNVGHHNLINLYKIPSNVVYLDMPSIYIDGISQDHVSYSDGNVTVSMKVSLKYMSEQDKFLLSYYDSYGLYVMQNDNVSLKEDYYSVKENGGMEFYITLDIPRDDFIFDYDNFTATCANEIVFKSYTIDGYGIRNFCDEKSEDIICHGPVVTTGGTVSVDKTSAIVKCTYENCTFWNATCGLEYFTDNTTEELIVFPEENEIEIHLTELKSDATYQYRAYYELNGNKVYGETKSFTTEKSSDAPTPGEAIDLGLSVKWASHNVGASSPEGYGGYYAWGETEEKSDYDWDTYNYANIGSNISGTQYDVAHVKWGGSWRMPTRDEIEELVNNCTWIETAYNGEYGQLVIGPNGNSIFLPAAGYRFGTDLYDRGSYGYYWSATSGENYSDYAYGLYFDYGGSLWYCYSYRYIRPHRSPCHRIEAKRIRLFDSFNLFERA